MAENLFASAQTGRETVCIDTYRVIDSCRDRDCYKDTKCYLTPLGQDLIEKAEKVRAKYAKVLSAHIDTEEVPFNNGFYQLNIRLFIKLFCEAYLCAGNVEEFSSICTVNKKVVLYGGEGSVDVFKGQCGRNAFYRTHDEDGCAAGDTMPVTVVETVDPIVLDIKISDNRQDQQCCSRTDIPQGILREIGGCICNEDTKKILTASLGLFSVIRIERPSQLLISAGEYNVPEKQCFEEAGDDPCRIFNGLPFPEKEFNSTQCRPQLRNSRCSCTNQ